MSGEERGAALASWSVVRLGDVADIRLGKMLSPKAFLPDLTIRPYLRNENVRWGCIDLSDVKQMGFRAEELERYSLQPGDLLVCEGGEPGRAAVYRGNPSGLMYQKALHRVRPHGDVISTALLGYWLEYLARSGRLAPRIAQTTIQHLPLERFEAVEIPLPPRRQQEAILSAIEQQMTRIEAGLRGLERAKAQLARYRASVLKAACEGRLVPTEAALARAEGREYESGRELLDRNAREWSAIPATVRKAPKRRGRDESLGDTSRGVELPGLPNGWIWVHLAQLIQSLRNGTSTVPRAVSGTKILRISAVRPLKVDLDDVRYLEQPLDSFTEYRLTEGDLLFTRYNGTIDLVGVAGVVGPGCEDTVHPDKLIRVRIIKGLCIPQFVAFAASTGASRRFISSRIRTTAGQAGVSGADLRAVPIPLPPIAEQERIVQDVERRLAIADQISAITDAGLARAARLRQAILKRAFEGKLVPQDPTDEPASLLLERIRKEREAAAQAAPRTPRQRRTRSRSARARRV